VKPKKKARQAEKKQAAAVLRAELARPTDLPPLPSPPTEPREVHPVLRAFPAKVIGTLLPNWDDIPETFKRYMTCPWHDLAARWFASSSGMGEPFPADVEFHGKPGVSPEKAYHHIDACLRSFEPKHEHKIAGVSWLIECFLEKVVIPSEKKEYTSSGPKQ
jgi:hypothetical protein